MNIKQVEEAVSKIYPQVSKLSMQMNNIDMFAKMNGFKIDWQTGNVKENNYE